MTGTATAADITSSGVFDFKLVMFALPILLIVIAGFVYRAKVTLTEEEHARIVNELEENWPSLKESDPDLAKEHIVKEN